MRDAAANWSHWKIGSTVRGLVRTKAHDTVSIKARARRKPKSGESAMKAPVVSRPVQAIALTPDFVRPAPTNPPIRACELLDGMPAHQGDEIPKDGAGQGTKDHLRVHDIGRDDTNADRSRDVHAENQKSDKIEKGGPHHRIARPQHPRGYKGRNRVGGIMHPVEEVERQRDDNQAN